MIPRPQDVNLQAESIQLKDLGAQIGWDTVFYIEYAGPIAIHVLCYYLFASWNGVPQPAVKTCALSSHSCLSYPLTSVARRLMIMFVLHFAKREFETAFVHRFSNGTMPVSNLFKNCSHYWLLGGLFYALDLYRGSHTTLENPLYVNLLTGLWVVRHSFFRSFFFRVHSLGPRSLLNCPTCTRT